MDTRAVLSLALLSFLKVAASAETYANHECSRPCVAGDTKICKYDLLLEAYATMSKACDQCPFNPIDCKREDCVTADGVPRLIYSINRMLPGPQIRVCQNDVVHVKFTNHLINGEGTSIHFHGVHQRDTVYMDGVAMITQCPILPLESFIYRFNASQAGTHYYHAHVGTQRGDGIAGAFIVKATPEVAAGYQDQPEHTLVIQDWFHALASGKGALHLHRPAVHKNNPESLIVNGIAQGSVSSKLLTATGTATITPAEAFEEIPPAVFNVNKDSTYRFRVISNAVMNCPIEVYIYGHELTVVATDGEDLQPQKGSVVVLSGGERWDFLVEANQNRDNYWIYFRGVADCRNTPHTHAILHYNGAEDPNIWYRNAGKSTCNKYGERRPDMPTINPFLGETEPVPDEVNKILLTDLKSAKTTPSWLTESANVTLVRQFYLLLGLHKINNPLFNVPKLYPCYELKEIAPGIEKEVTTATADCTVLAQIDRTNGELPRSPYLSQYHDIDPAKFCDVGTTDQVRCDKEFCQCIHRIKVNVGEVVELILIDRALYWNVSNHPMHIHGQYMYVLAEGQNPSLATTKQEVIDLDDAGKIKRNFDKPIAKDTIMMPLGGYVVVRFLADNPGPWLFHCHNELHVEQGMFMVIQVGDPDEWPRDPTPRYKCGPYKAPTTTHKASTTPHKAAATTQGTGSGHTINKGVVSLTALLTLLSVSY